MAGSLFIVAAPSGAGKSSLVNALLARDPGIKLSISHTTRGPRPGDEDGVHYHFVDRARFGALIDAGAFLEYAEVHGNLYGTSRAAVEPLLAAGHDVLLEIDYQGARSVRMLMPAAVGIFILPPSRAALEERLHKRGQDNAEVIAKRLANSREEIGHVHEFDYVIVNERFEQALDDLGSIVRAQRLRRATQGERLERLVQSLLA
jgi:guanylate kinase